MEIKTESYSIKVTPKEGFEIDKENSTLEEIVFKKTKQQLPKKWEDILGLKKEGYYIDIISRLQKAIITDRGDKNCFPSKEEAEACLALSQLCTLRDIYNGEPMEDWCDWIKGQNKYIIFLSGDNIHVGICNLDSRVLAFKTPELRDEFLENFRDLILTARPLL